MPVIQIRRGLDVPVPGAIESAQIIDGPPVRTVAPLPQESLGIKLKLLVQEGARVRAGQPLYLDKQDPGAPFVAPGGGEIVTIHRGARRAVLSIVIQLDRDEEREEHGRLDPVSASADQLRERAARSGWWPSLRRRPFGHAARTGERPRSVFVTAADTQPLAPPPTAVLAGREDAFALGLRALGKLAEAPVFVCGHARDSITALVPGDAGAEVREFAGPHPAGNAGVHIHELDPAGPGRTVWHVGCRCVADLGDLLLTGTLPLQHVVAVVGPGAVDPALVRTRRGAATEDLCRDRLGCDPARVVNGSPLSGAVANPGTPQGFLGRYTNQLTILDDGTEREFLGWLNPVGRRHSITNTLLAKFFGRRLRFDTDANGSVRAIVPIGAYEKVMPMDILATQLIRALASDDIETAEKLGVLELVEEDLALCEYVCPSKLDIGAMLRRTLDRIQKEG